jgi:cobalt-precorrin-5B (C1)-methyltransferase
MAVDDDAAVPGRRALRSGWTTGTCAAAAAAAAFQVLLTGRAPACVAVRLPRGGEARLPLARAERCAGGAVAAVIKDAGDDPDVTHGAEIVVTVAVAPEGTGVVFRAGEGVGTVTRPGLPLEPGEPAINPGPRAMIRDALAGVAAAAGHGNVDAVVTVAVPGGEALAAKTLNGRLGVVGGLSILGTTGVVVPFSCAAWIHSIHRGIDVARATGHRHLIGATGSTSEAAAQKLFGLPDVALIDMGDFVGGMLKYLRDHPVGRVTVAGGIGKMTKMAQGAMDLHSGRSQVDFDFLAARVTQLGGAPALVEAVRRANSALEVETLAHGAGLPVADEIARTAREQGLRVLRGAAVALDTLVVDRKGVVIGRAG